MSTFGRRAELEKVKPPAYYTVRNIAIGLTVLGAIGLAYALYLIIARPYDPSVLNPSMPKQQEASRQRGFNILWVSLLVIAVPWLIWWIFF